MSKTPECPSCLSLTKKIKILQADYDFEIKKLTEDQSSEKALLELNTNKQIKKLQDKLQNQKQQRLKQNETWIVKYDELIQKHQTQLAHYKNQKDSQTQLFKKSQQSEFLKFKTDTVSALENTIQSLKQEKQTLRQQLTSQFESKIQQIHSKNDQKVAKIITKHEQQLLKKCNQYEATILGIQSEKNVEENLHKKTKEESKDTQIRMNQEIYSLKKSIFEHQEKIVTLKKQIQEKCQKVEMLKSQIVKKSAEHDQKISQLAKDYENKYEMHKQTTEKRMQQLFKRELQNCSKFQKALEKIQEHREMQNQMYKANLNEIKSCVDERPSRYEDVDEIITLKDKLTKKQRECETLSEELKWYRLELENKEETYNRIFGLEQKPNESIYIRRKDLKVKRTGKSVTTVREILGTVNTGNNLAPLIGNVERKLLPPKQNKIL